MEKHTNVYKKGLLFLLITLIIIITVMAGAAVTLYYLSQGNAVSINSITNRPIVPTNNLDITNAIKLDFETLELAQTNAERQIGYMNRESICVNCGMLFIFEQTQPLSFWMKNTLVPLKIIFIDERGIVINSGIGQPQVTSPSVEANRPGKYVLEVPLDSKVKLNPGDVLDLDYLKSQGKAHSTIGKL
jgi:uncharacterized protein